MTNPKKFFKLAIDSGRYYGRMIEVTGLITTKEKRNDMNKYTFVLDVVTDGSLDTDSIAQTLIANVENEGVYAAVKPVKVSALKEQGFKVWRARVAGITEASLQPEKVEAEVAVASAS